MTDAATLRAEAGRLTAATGFDSAERSRGLARALQIYRDLADRRGECVALTRLGNIAINVADYPAALDYLHAAQALAGKLDDGDLQRDADGQLAHALSELGENEAALAMVQRRFELDAGSPEPESRLLALNMLGCLLSTNGRHEEALARLREADAIVASIADPSRRAHMRSQSLADLSDALLRAGRAAEALDHAERGAAAASSIAHRPLVMLNQLYAGRAAVAESENALAADRLAAAAALAAEMGHKSHESQARLALADALAAVGRFEEALAAYREGHRLEREIRREDAARRLEFQRSRREIEAAQREKENADRVLFAVLPPPIARRMKEGEARIAEDVPDVSILFSDLVGFTGLATRTSARDLLDLLDRIFSTFDQLADAQGLEKVKTIGDAYMAVGGALAASPDHLERSARLGLEMLRAVDRLAVEGGPRLAIRIGLHAGPAVAGVIGKRRLNYDLWGETVNLASRLESSGVAGRIHVSAAVAQRLGGAFAFEPRGIVQIKGLGEMRTFLLAAP